MRALAAVVRLIDRFNGAIGTTVAWLMVPVVVVAFLVVALRYAFSIGFPWLQETYIWLHGAAFMLAAAWVLRDGGHVRVDVFARRFSPKTRAWVELFGVFAFLLPMMGVIFYMSLPAVQRSWHISEKSPTADGLEFLYLLKTIVPIACVLIMLQGLALAGRAILQLAGRESLLGASRNGGKR